MQRRKSPFRFPQALFCSCTDDDPASGFQELLGKGETDAGRPTGDQDCISTDFHINHLIPTAGMLLLDAQLPLPLFVIRILRALQEKFFPVKSSRRCRKVHHRSSQDTFIMMYHFPKYSATCFRFPRIGMPCGHLSSHSPHSLQSEAKWGVPSKKPPRINEYRCNAASLSS